MGALPFDGGGRLIVPACIVQRDEYGAMWRTVVEPPAALMEAINRSNARLARLFGRPATA